MNDADKLVEKDLASAQVLQKWVEDIQRWGSFSDRRPDLGKMHKCPMCQRRHRMIAPRCSNADYATTKRAWGPEEGFHQVECPQRVIEALFGQNFKKKIFHKKHGQTRVRSMRLLTFRMQASDELIAKAAKEMQVPVPQIAAIPSFATQYFIFKENIEQRRIRGQRRIARQINQGTKPGGSRYRDHVARIHKNKSS